MRSSRFPYIALALVLVVMSGCKSGGWSPRWDFWRSSPSTADTQVVPPGSTAGAPVRPSTIATAPTGGAAYPAGVTPPAGTTYPNSGLSAAPGATGTYGAASAPYGSYPNTTAPHAGTASTTSPYAGATSGPYGAATGAAPASYESTSTPAGTAQTGPYGGTYGQTDTSATAAAPTTAVAGNAAPADRYESPATAGGGYNAGSRYDAAAADRYATPAAATELAPAAGNRYEATTDAVGHEAGPAATTADARSAYSATTPGAPAAEIPVGGATNGAGAPQPYRPAGTGSYSPMPVGNGPGAAYPNSGAPQVNGAGATYVR